MRRAGWGGPRRRCSYGPGDGSPRRAAGSRLRWRPPRRAGRDPTPRASGAVWVVRRGRHSSRRHEPGGHSIVPCRCSRPRGEVTTERSENRPLHASIIGHNMGTVMSTLVGTCLNNRYRLDAQIGAGGMSTVYRAFDTTLERQVAVKLMHREIASDSDQLERFRREARSLAQLNHPHIVGVIDAGEEDGRPYIVFEYVEGETLKERIRRMGRLPIDEAIAYALEIARALGAAHARNIVHRDIKPQNVLVDEEGSAKVTDFGIARSLEEEGLTADGRVLGTTDYVSPEQALGHDVDGRGHRGPAHAAGGHAPAPAAAHAAAGAAAAPAADGRGGRRGALSADAGGRRAHAARPQRRHEHAGA